MVVPVIDLFAGPGGLGEGFSSIVHEKGRVFEIKLSVEMDINAHKTLELRSFFRSFPEKQAPEEYYMVMSEPDTVKREGLIKELFVKYPRNAEKAKEEAWCAELGSDQFPASIVDKRITAALEGQKNWLLIGGPPCQAYSLVGRSRRKWKNDLDATDKRVHLYKEYLRIIAVHHPAVFVMENVKGLLSSKVDGELMFDLIKRDLSSPDSVFPDLNAPGYKIYSFTTTPSLSLLGQPYYNNNKDFLIRSEEYKVPQKRHRVILLGIREDIDVLPQTLVKEKNQISLAQVIGDLPKIRSGISRSFISSQILSEKKKRFYRNEIDSDNVWEKLINSFREDIVSWQGFAKEYSLAKIKSPPHSKGAEFIDYKTPSTDNPLYDWYSDKRLKGVSNHESRSHLVQDIKRYMFSSMFTKINQRFPRLQEFDDNSLKLLPDHENAESGKFEDRFRVQLPDNPATTITSHISKDGHYFIHYDPDQCRSFTVREAARVQTFPDNYLFRGSRTAQFHQVGNAVPPLLAFKIAGIVEKIFNSSNTDNKDK